MTWIFYSAIMFVFSNVVYLAIRKAQKDEIPVQLYSVAMFLVPAITYFVLSMILGHSLLLEPQHLALVLLAALFWSYLGNFFSQRGIKQAPNPGYSLILQKSYVVLTTLAAVVLFGSSLPLHKAFAIIVILIFIGVTSIGGKTHAAGRNWVVLSLLAHLCFAFGSLISKQFLVLGLVPFVYSFYISGFVSVANIWEAKYNKLSLTLTKKQLPILLIIGFAGVIFNLSMQFGYKYAPNPGFVAAINASSIMSVTVLSAFLYKDELTRQKIIGVLGTLVGLGLLVLS